MLPKCLIIIVLILFSLETIAQKVIQTKIDWSISLPLPIPNGSNSQFGLAGASSGLNNDVMLIAGGSNFAEGVPWKGGKKKYYDDIYVLKKEDKSFAWAKKTYKLPFKLAYSATVTSPKGLVCIGGENEKGLSQKVIMLQWNAKNEEVEINFLTDLPIAITNASATILNNLIFLIGGEINNETLNSFYQLDISINNAQWEKLPNLPEALSHSVAVVQSEKIYLFGGRSKTESGISKLSNKAFCFNPKKKEWKTLKNISDENKEIPALSAGLGLAFGNEKILLIGGDKGNVFFQIETNNAKIALSKDENEKSRLQTEKVALLENHQGFSKDIYSYDIHKNTWSKFGEIPIITPVTTNIVKWDDIIFIPSGEIKPGIRTSNVLMGKITKQ